MSLEEIVKTDHKWRKFQHSGKTCLVIGGARGVWEDFTQAKKDTPEADVLAVNAIGCYVPGKLNYWFSLHAFYLKTWHTVRKMTFKGHGYQKPALWALRHTGEGVEKGDMDAVWQFGDPTISRSAKRSGSLEDSGFFAMCIALVLGYSRVHLVGCPADDSGHVFIPKWEYLEHDKEAIRRAWVSTLDTYPECRERVRSYSGLTQELLGAP
jgi:hypothetical protein